MIAKFKFELDDLIAIQSFLATKSKSHRRNRLLVSAVAAIGLMVFIMLIFKVNFITGAIVSAAFFYVSYKYISKKSMEDQAKRIAKKDPTLVNVECTLTVSDKGLLREFKNSTSNLGWEEIKFVSEDDERYFLYMSDVHVIVLNKNPYNMSKEETREYNTLLRNYFNQHNIAVE
ncbi:MULTISPECIES: YcxB family protein [unclassified Oceanobacillus]|uniref:YcxB family protein n=1 Tax=unclassified Oceanobacillus TaxID=2630292 RepID=UPI00300E28A3